LPIELTTEDIRNTKAYKEYYACAIGEATPKPKASARTKRGGSASSTTPPTPIATPTPITTIVAAPRLTAAAKGKQPARATSPTDPSEQGGSSTDEGTGSKPGVPDVPSDDSEEEISWNSSDDKDVDDQTKGRDVNEGEKTDADDDDQDKAEKDNVDDDDEEEISKIDKQVDTESGGDDEETKSDRESEEEETREKEDESFDPIPKTPKDSEDDGNGEDDQGLRISMESIFTTASSSVAPLPSPTSTMTPSIITKTTIASQPPIPPSSIPNWLQDSLQIENDKFLRTIDDNMKKIIKEQVKSQVKAQVTRILPRIEESVNAQLEAEVLTRSSHSSRTSYAVAADLSEMELKKILIDNMEGNKSIQRSDEQRNIYKALVEAYEADKTILDSYGESTILKRRREDDDDQEEPSTGSDRGSTTETQSRQLSASESAFVEEPVQTTCQMEEPSHLVFKTCAEDQPIVQTSQHPEWFSQPRKPPTPDRDLNKTLPVVQGNAQFASLIRN
nr:hypothetical protein [Tanacetum cinerariifolium]